MKKVTPCIILVSSKNVSSERKGGNVTLDRRQSLNAANFGLNKHKISQNSQNGLKILIMNLNPELKKQLMELTGMKDESEFQELVQDMLPSIAKAAGKTPNPTGDENSSTNNNQRTSNSSPFQLHFVKMCSLLGKPCM